MSKERKAWNKGTKHTDLQSMIQTHVAGVQMGNGTDDTLTAWDIGLILDVLVLH